MDIVRENVNALNAVLKLKVNENDYRDKVDQVLKNYKKKMNIPGFRPGMVPMGMVKKMYGVSVKADEINKILNEAIHNYIESNDIEILGNPLPSEDDNHADFAATKDFEFNYDLGLAPTFDINLSDKHKFTKYVIKVDKELINKNKEDLFRRYGSLKPVEKVGEKDMVTVQLKELGKEEGEGFEKKTSIYTEFIEDKKEKEKILGLKHQEKAVIDPRKLAKEEQDVLNMLGITADQLKELSKEFELEVISSHEIVPAEENQEFYDRIFGPGKVTSKEEFEKKTTSELEQLVKGFSDRKLKKDVIEFFIKKLKLTLPDDFLKRWLDVTNKELTKEQIEEEYEKFSRDMKWMLVENKIVKENDIQTTMEELTNYGKELLVKQFAQYGIPAPEDDKLNDYAKNMLANQEEARKLNGELMERKIVNLLNEKLTLKEKEVTYSEFEKLLTEKPSKFNLFNKLKF